MSSHMYATDLFTLAEIRREELLQQAEQHRLARKAAGGNDAREPRRGDLGSAARALRARFGAIRARSDRLESFDVTLASGPETASRV